MPLAEWVYRWPHFTHSHDHTKRMKENYPGFRIKQLTALIAIDEDDDEGVLTLRGPQGTPIPCIAADEVRLKDFMKIAAELVQGGQIKKIKIIQFTDGKILQTFEQ